MGTESPKCNAIALVFSPVSIALWLPKPPALAYLSPSLKAKKWCNCPGGIWFFLSADDKFSICIPVWYQKVNLILYCRSSRGSIIHHDLCLDHDKLITLNILTMNNSISHVYLIYHRRVTRSITYFSINIDNKNRSRC